MLTKILIAIAVLLIALIVVIVTRPENFKYSRSATIEAPPQVLFEQINDLRNFQKWNPWAKVDPSSVITFAGPATGVDSAYTWKGNKDVGEGTMTIVESKPGELVRARMDFKKPMAATHTAEFTFKPDGNQTLVTWSMSGTNNFMGKAFGLVVDCDKMVGTEFSKGLATLKALMEPAPKG
jgi:hypothetical protein